MRFLLECKSDIKRLCKEEGEKQKKSDIVHCLSEQKRNSVLREIPTPLSRGCEDQVTFEGCLYDDLIL